MEPEPTTPDTNFLLWGEARFYTLEIYSPDSLYDVIAKYEAPYPFPSIQRGQLVRALDQGEQSNDWILEVTQVEHIVSAIMGPVKFITCLYTKRVPNAYADRKAAFKACE